MRVEGDDFFVLFSWKTCTIILSIWNKGTMHCQPAWSTRNHVSIHLSCSVHLCAFSLVSEPHTLNLRYASGKGWCENAICSHTIRSTLAAVHTMPCLFITSWHMAKMVIDFIYLFYPSSLLPSFTLHHFTTPCVFFQTPLPLLTILVPF